MPSENGQAGTRKSRDLPIPAITDDAAERKRVLNVLAQRRYRKRRKERLQRLQAQVENPVEVRASTDAAAAGGGGGLADSHLNSQDLSLLPVPVAGWDNDSFAPPDVHPPPDLGQFFDIHPNSTGAGLDQDLSSQLQLSESLTFTFPDDHILEIPSLRLLNAAVKVALRLNVAHLLWDVDAASPFYRGAHTPSSLPSLSSLPSSSSSDSGLDLDIDLSLPTHLHPTRTQLLLPHHPVLDILPWPSTRDKLIQIFNLPAPVRPQSAQDPLGLFRLVYDMEDEGGEGVRVTGADVFDPGSWEIGQVVFQRWWWAFEAQLVQRWDRVRKARGESALAMRAATGAATDTDTGTE
ncbi:hypothetical protein BDW72DRAFT_172494 [Aspergillus terricola var. indicus]